MTVPRHYAFSLLLQRPLPSRGSTVIEVTREAGGWIAWLVDMDAPESTRKLGPFPGRRDARRAARAALDAVAGCPASKGVRAKKNAGLVRDPRQIFDAVKGQAALARLRST